MNALATLATALLALLAAAHVARAGELLVNAPVGTFQGVYAAGKQARSWLGVPYSLQPVGERRWTDPEYPAPHKGVFQADSFGPQCIQHCQLEADSCAAVSSEACLFLNIYAPRAETALPGPWPVALFVHGGNFKEGNGGTVNDGFGPLYTGRYMANTSSVVTVTLNYRLGALGFLASPNNITGNFGIKDQQMALKWIRGNIHAFGGDPTRVTVMGQSAGSVSAAIHTFSPASKGLVHGAAMISELPGLPLRTAENAHAVAAAFASFAGCGATDNACLRALNTTQVLAAQTKIFKDLGLDASAFLESFMPFAPTIDPQIMPYQPYTAVVNGHAARVPVIMGNVAQEGNLFIYTGFGKPVPALEYDVLVGVVIGNLTGAAEVLKEYPARNATDARLTMSNLTDAGVFFGSTRNMSWTYTAQGPPAFRYVFDHVPSFSHKLWGNTTWCYDVTCHGSDLWAYFNPVLEYKGYLSLTAEEEALAQRVSSYFANFFHTGNPNTPPRGLAPPPGLAWPVANRTTDQIMYFQTPSDKVVTGFQKAECDLFDSIGYPLP